jgi:poly-beta-hydroxyalkanoate depolymerase
MAMNIDRHVTAHLDMFKHLVTGDEDPARSTAGSTTNIWR